MQRWKEPAGAYGGRERLRARRGFGSQLSVQGETAQLVLVERLVPAPGQREAAHAAPVRLLQPGLHAELQPGSGHRVLEVARGLEGRVLVLQDVEGEPVIVLLLVEHPGLERFAVGHRKAGEEVCAQRLGQKLQAPPWSSGQWARERLQRRDVKRVVAGGIELHVGQCDEEKRRGPADPPVVGRRDVAVAGRRTVARRHVVSERPPHADQRLAEVRSCDRVGALGPEEAGEGLPAVRTIGLHNQVSEERAGLVRLETVDGFPVHFDTEAPQQTHDKPCHGEDAPT